MMIENTTVETFAKEIVEKLEVAINKKGSATLAVSGGSTPVKLFQNLREQSLAWDKVTLTLCDERCVDTSSTQSNAHLVREYLLQNRAKDVQFLPLYDDISIESSLQNAPQDLDIDVLILGMGTDAHTASLFPNNEKLPLAYDTAYKEPFIHIIPQTAPYERISMTLRTIIGAGQIYLHFEGDEKEEVLQKALQNEDIYTYPILSVIKNAKNNMKVYKT